jgi:Domain of unknown function (DUF4175)
MMSWQLQQVLERVARRVRELRLWSSLALCWLAWALIGSLLAVSGAHSVLIVSAFAALALSSGLACVIFAMRSGRDLRGVARRIEAAHPDLDAGLLTAVEEGPPGPLQRMGFLQETVVFRALEHHRAHDWTKVIAQRAIHGARLAHLAALGGLALVSIALVIRATSDPRIDGTGAAPAAALSSEVQVTPGDTELEKGSSLLVVARFPGAVPPEAKLVVADSSSASAAHAMTRSLEDPTFAGRVESVVNDLSYHIEFAGEKSPTYRVRVFENPELIRADAQLEYPAYTSSEPKTVEDIRHVTAVERTRLTLLFRLNKEVASAKLVDEKGQEIALAPPAAPGPPVYRTSFTLEDSHRYKLQLVDREGRKNKLSADLSVNVTRNRPPTIAISQPGHDVRVSPVEELRVKSRISDDFGVVRHGVSLATAGMAPLDVVLSDAASPRPKLVQFEHLIDFEALKAVPDQLVTYFVWAEDFGPDGKPRRTEGDMYFAEVRHFEEIFREGEQPSSASAENEQDEQGGGNARQAEQLTELQKEVINATWKVIRRETGTQPTDKFIPDTKVLRESQESVVTRAEALGGRLQDAASKANLEQAMKSMKDAIRLLGEASARVAVGSMHPALAAEQVAYQALLKLRAREFEVVRNRSRQRGGRGSGASAFQRQLNQLELTNREDRFEEQNRARKQLSPKEQEQRETRQVLSRLKELAQRQADLNDRLKELQSALEAAKDEPARQEIERQLKRLREQQQQILRDTDELQERMENEQNRERMAQARQQVQDARSHVRQASEALERGRVPQALTEGTRAGQQLGNVRDDLRKQASNQFSDDLTQMRDQAKQLHENQDRLSDELDAWKNSRRQALRDPNDRRQLKQTLEQQGKNLDQLVEHMRRTVGEAEETEPLLARNLFDTVRKAEEQMIPEAIQQTRKLADAGFAEEASKSSRIAGKGIEQLRQGVERAARSVLGDETAALRRAQSEVEELANQINREIAQATGQPPGDQENSQQPGRQVRQGEQRQDRQQAGQANQPGKPGQQGQQGPQRQQGQQQAQRGQRGQQQAQRGRRGQGRQQRNQGDSTARTGEQEGQAQGRRQAGSLRGGNTPQDGGSSRPDSRGGPGGNRRAGDGRPGVERMLGQLAGIPNGPAGPITGEGFREWSDRMRDVEELLEDPALRAEAARIRDRVRGAREEFKRHAKMPDWTRLKGLVADPIRELRDRIAEEVRRRESPDSLVPIDRDPVPPKFAQGVRRYYERLGSGR